MCVIRVYSESGRGVRPYATDLSNSELRPTAIDGKLGAGREGRIEREEEDGLGDFLRLPPALQGNHALHLLLNLGGRVFIGKHFAEDYRVDGAGRHSVNANLARNQLGGERPSE